MKVCVVSFDIVGPVRNGGIGTAMTALSELLAGQGHDVTILYPGSFNENNPLTACALHFQEKSIRFEPLFVDERELYSSYAAYQWLKHRAFDVIHFHDWRGVGYWSFQAKQMGLAFLDTVLVCQVHGQTIWHATSSGEFLYQTAELEFDYIEQRSVEMADVIYSPSQYMIDYMQSRSWELPANRVVRPNLLPAHFYAPEARVNPCGQEKTVHEIVFFGRLETRKGIELFCDAINLLVKKGVSLKAVTFLGKEGMSGSEPALALIARASEGWAFPFQVISDYDITAANQYLAGEGRLAVIASSIENSPYTVLECLAKGVPFLASNVGGVRELVADAYVERVIYRYDGAALAASLERALTTGAIVAAPRISIEDNKRDWLNWHDSLRPPLPKPAIVDRRPLVSVCMSHFARTHFLEVAIKSLEAQSYDRIELVLVDDASPDAATKPYLDALEPRFAAREWSLIRNEQELWSGACRNLAVSKSRGDYVLLMDDDNVAFPDEVETFVRAATYLGADALTCQQQVFSSDNSGPPGRAEVPIGWMPLGPNIAQGFFENCLGDLNMFVKRDVWDAIGGFTDERYGCEDYEFLLELVLSGYKLACVPELLFCYRNSERSLAKRYNSISLYNSFMRPLRPFKKRSMKGLSLAFDLAQNRRYYEMRRDRVSYWSVPTGSADPAHAIASAACNSGLGPLEMARLAFMRGQFESAAKLYQQARRSLPNVTDAKLDSLSKASSQAERHGSTNATSD